VSSVYDTDPVGPPQPDFLNAVAEVHTSLGPRELLARLKSIESELGREPAERWGPREIDLDLLLYGDEVVESDDLRLPHPEMTGRAFVLVPLAEIAPDVVVTGQGRVAELRDRTALDGVRYYAEAGSLAVS
jgi:2-amino-4-hydroxy-6-hydroxymethyldihydropteridine diphosphokinase